MMYALQRRPGLHFIGWRLGLLAAQTATTSAERACLCHYAAGKRRLVEVGVWHGVNTANLRRVMSPDGLLVGVDHFPPGRFGAQWQKWIAKAEVRATTNGTVIFLEHTSVSAALEYAQRYPDPVDFIFLDGDHSFDGVSADWKAWSALLGSGAVVALHDSRSYPGRDIGNVGSARFAREVLRIDPRLRLIDAVDSLSILQTGDSC